MKEEQIKLILEGYNKEKIVLVDKLASLTPRESEASFGKAWDVRCRLREIDRAIIELLK